jgi:P22 tail accessory factor
MWTKRDVVLQALEELGLSSVVYDLQPEQLESVKRRLDVMMAAWNAEGVRLGYPLNLESSDLDDPSGLPDLAIESVYLNLAVMIGPMFGRVVSETTKARAIKTLGILKARAHTPPRQILPASMPSGAGNRARQPFLSSTPEPLTDGSGGVIVE